ncbi:hypothetical protein GCM10017786_26860 [Amycolatopsis deserti]|uniref:Tetratricopeptide repeat protein n=1 Tax=Amycolatopsis deserti TaxID=185696 RepID=A0ABQ3IT70_9PSEU|nr:hypothetical protein [Amycolatopsis deserti]GHE92801.1 hypothetical protein GCM10017786_26860 [Amycolatopsis deserti]
MSREELARAMTVEPAEARRILLRLWEEGSAVDRCAAAHFLADRQDSPEEELLWDLRALEVAAAADPAEVRGFFPSLHLNLGDVYRRLGDVPRAREHLAAARAEIGTLEDDGYGRMIRGGIARLAERLGMTDTNG